MTNRVASFKERWRLTNRFATSKQRLTNRFATLKQRLRMKPVPFGLFHLELREATIQQVSLHPELVLRMSYSYLYPPLRLK